MVTDLAGFAAATWHRGVPVVHVADHAAGDGRRRHRRQDRRQPARGQEPRRRVLAAVRRRLRPRRAGLAAARERRSGDGEMAKYHFLTGDDLEAMDLTDRIARCVEIKAAVVAADEREGDRRALLNYGHTLAHALEIATDHAVTHGEAVGVGLVYAADAGPPARADRRRRASTSTGGSSARPTGCRRRCPRPRPRHAGRADGPRQEGPRRADVRARRRPPASRSLPASTRPPFGPRSTSSLDGLARSEDSAHSAWAGQGRPGLSQSLRHERSGTWDLDGRPGWA